MRNMLEPVQITYYLAYLNIYLISLHCKLKVINNVKYMKMNIFK